MARSAPHRFLSATALAVGLGVATAGLAFHRPGQSGFDQLALRDRQHCSGPHCTVIATWIKQGSGSKHYTLTGTLNMDTHLVPSDARNGSGNPPPFRGGEVVTVPVNASGEFTGYAASLSDSPPITFFAGGRLHIETAGLPACEIVTLLTGPRPEMARCKLLPTVPDAEGTWTDAVRVFGPNAVGGYTVPSTNVSCSPTSAGTEIRCTSTVGFIGRVLVELRRTVDNVRWNGVGVVADDPPEPWFQGNDPFPATMVSTAFLDFAPAGLPDLVVEDVTVAPANPVTGTALSLGARIRNAGARDAGASQAQLRIDIGSDGRWEVGPSAVPTGSLAPGASEQETWSWTAVHGTHRAEICADAQNAVPESNEDNCLIRVFHVFMAPSVSLTAPETAFVGDPVNATGSVTDRDRDLATRTWLIAAPGCTLPPYPTPAPACAAKTEGPAPHAETFTEVTALPTGVLGTVCARLDARDTGGRTGSGLTCTAVTARPSPSASPSPLPSATPSRSPSGVAPPVFREVPP